MGWAVAHWALQWALCRCFWHDAIRRRAESYFNMAPEAYLLQFLLREHFCRMKLNDIYQSVYVKQPQICEQALWKESASQTSERLSVNSLQRVSDYICWINTDISTHWSGAKLYYHIDTVHGHHCDLFREFWQASCAVIQLWTLIVIIFV